MNLMLVAVVVVSVAIGQVSTGLIVALLIVLNVVLGSRQELKARASVDALSNLQCAAGQGCPGRHLADDRRPGCRPRRHRHAGSRRPRAR